MPHLVQKEQDYRIPRQSLELIFKDQLDAFESEFEKDTNGNILIPFEHKGYTCNNDTDKIKDSKIQAISFFSGAGGLDIGTQLAGVKVLSSLDFFQDSVNTLKANRYFEHTQHSYNDIANVSGTDYTHMIKENNPEKLILVGGPPCQPFSKAGYWVTNEKRKANEDPRNMIGQYFRLISEIKPDGFILENVESILHPSNRSAVESIEETTQALGYNYILLNVNSADFGIPQKRKRVFFLATKKDINGEMRKTHGSEKERLQNPNLLPYERVVDWIGKYDNEMYHDPTTIAEGKYFNNLMTVPPGKNYIALSERAGHPNPQFVAGKRYWSFLLKLHPNLPSWTIISKPGHWEGPFHWNNRRLTIREAAAIQTFPEDYIFTGSHRSQRLQIGNAVPPLLGKQVIEHLCRWL
ncbi:DNA cytosine methyltransferase [Bacillus marasmi]|uniref:DNA cytosine methyltransferase n=1 Tax=Bacillus marasmi TaxID=1926279 RepID=UPI0011C7CD24|nr:DNA cytosine methyltransferase [Bacillus marasmi]